MSRSAMKVAVNPLPWMLTPSGWDLSETTLRQALSDLKDVGFRALHAQVPDGMGTEDYRRVLADYGFTPAPGYFSADFSDSPRHRDVVEAARQAAHVQAQLGLTTMFIASDMSAERRSRPARGHLSDETRLRHITDGLVAAAEAMAAEGVTSALHPHVGTWVETDSEVRSVLDWSDGTALAFGPDTGHLFWGGSDPAAMVSRYASRVACLHLKDVDASAVAAAASSDDDYAGATFGRHVWTEPGRGSVDIDAVVAALPEDFDGWAVLEVDVPNLPDRVESSRAGLDYLRTHPAFETSAP